MKAIKIVVIILALSLCNYANIKVSARALINLSPEDNNSWIADIENRISDLSNTTGIANIKKLYTSITDYINVYHKEMKLGNTAINNNDEQDRLTKSLLNTYSSAFEKEANKVFRGTNWVASDVNLIKAESNALLGNEKLNKTSKVYNNIKTIKSIADKYNEITVFIKSCKSFSFTNYDLDSNFPINDVINKINRANSYIRNGVGNALINNNKDLLVEIKDIPRFLMMKHVHFLQNKVNNFKTEKEYAVTSVWETNFKNPLKNEFNGLKNTIYKDVFDADRYNNLFIQLESL